MVAGSSVAESVKPLTLKTPIAAMAGIGPKRAEALNDKGIRIVEDLLFHLPARYQDWRERRTIAQLEPGIVAVVEGTLSGVRERPMPGARWRRLVTARSPMPPARSFGWCGSTCRHTCAAGCPMASASPRTGALRKRPMGMWK